MNFELEISFGNNMEKRLYIQNIILLVYGPIFEFQGKYEIEKERNLIQKFLDNAGLFIEKRNSILQIIEVLLCEDYIYIYDIQNKTYIVLYKNSKKMKNNEKQYNKYFKS